jgi:hypothetical protein
MKNKFRIGFIGVLVASMFFLSACDDGTKASTYYYEAYNITMSQYNSFMSSHSNAVSYTFNEIKSARAELRSYNGTFIVSESGISESELQSFSSQHGISGSDYSQIKDHIDSVGNLIVFFSYAPDPSNYMIWMYIEKE